MPNLLAIGMAGYEAYQVYREYSRMRKRSRWAVAGSRVLKREWSRRKRRGKNRRRGRRRR